MDAVKLYYFPLLARGCGPALVAEFSGVAWLGPKDLGFDSSKDWAPMKASGISPFGQLPLLTGPDGLAVGQTTAIVQYFARKGSMFGATEEDHIMSDMLMQVAEDVYSLLSMCNPTVFAALGEKGKPGRDVYDQMWGTMMPPHLARLEKQFGKHGAQFTSTGLTAGELYLFSMLHQVFLCHNDIFKDTPQLAQWYKATAEHPKVVKVLSGQSSYGPLNQYYINPE